MVEVVVAVVVEEVVEVAVVVAVVVVVVVVSRAFAVAGLRPTIYAVRLLPA